MRADSKEYLYVPLETTSDLADNVIEISVQPPGGTISWQVAENTTGGARILVGPDTTVPLVSGFYHRVLVRVQDNPETPVLYAGAVFVE